MPSPADKSANVKQVFSDLNRKFEEEETKRRAAREKLPYFDLRGFPIDDDSLSIVPEDRAAAARAIIFFSEGPLLKIGIFDPRNSGLQNLLAGLKKKKYKPELYLVSQASVSDALKQYKRIIEVKDEGRHEIVVKTGDGVVSKLTSLGGIGERAAETPVTELLSLLIGSAAAMGASDIHLEPEKARLKIRFRVDGVLHDVVFLPKKIQRGLLSRIKLLSGLKLSADTPQDGRFSVKGEGKNLELRVSVLPSADGESVVMRVLGAAAIEVNIEKIGMRSRDLELVRREISKPNGMVLTTGPTGSGKTTTLYSFLSYLNTEGAKLITIEDPVEYRLKGIIQTPINRSRGVDFAGALRSILRQDPDVVMVGEIRDLETAQTAAQAALTGHMVLSTLHTNDAAGAIPRFLDLGVKPVTLAPALNVLMAQRLLRRICAACRQPARPGADELAKVKRILSAISPKALVQAPERETFYHSPGCPECHSIGYKGRVGVFEVFAVDDPIEQLIFKQASTNEIKQAAIGAGMLTMQQDGVLKAMAGETDLAEVWRVTEE